jgi:uncharacterized protein (UPF0333 family)
MSKITGMKIQNSRGQGFIEYALLLAVVVFIVIAVGKGPLKNGVSDTVTEAMKVTKAQAGKIGGS